MLELTYNPSGESDLDSEDWIKDVNVFNWSDIHQASAVKTTHEPNTVITLFTEQTLHHRGSG